MTSKLEPLGIKRIEGIHYYVYDLDRSRRFYVDLMDFDETWRSTPELERSARQRSVCFTAGDVNIVCSQPLGGAAARGASCRSTPTASAP